MFFKSMLWLTLLMAKIAEVAPGMPHSAWLIAMVKSVMTGRKIFLFIMCERERVSWHFLSLRKRWCGDRYHRYCGYRKQFYSSGKCIHVTLAKVSGIIEGSDLRIAARADEFENSRDITIQNFTLKYCNLNENPCGKNVVFRNIKFEGRSRENICSKIIDDPVSSNRKPSTTSQCRAVFNAKISGSTLLIRLTRFSAQKKGLSYLQIISFCGQVLFQTNIADHLTEYHTDLSAFARGVYTIRYGNQARQVVWYGRN